MKAIGGYFELELPVSNNSFMHSECILVNSGSKALEYILKVMGPKIKKVWLPYYTCEVLLHPLTQLGLKYDFYHINKRFQIDDKITLDDGEYIVINNYFGINDSYLSSVAKIYDDKIIVDNSQAWYAPKYPGIKAFYSPRKFFGVADGGVACIADTTNIKLDQDTSFDRCSHLLKRIDIGPAGGYNDFHTNSASLVKEPLKQMSDLTKKILASIDFGLAKTKRRSNYEILDELLRATNKLTLPPLDSFECPMVYPYLNDDETLRQRLIDNQIFVAKYWPNVMNWCNENTTEYYLTKYLIPLPIDQRYGESDMKRIIDVIKR